MKRNKKPLDREQLLEQMRALACAKVNDAVKLAYLPEEEREAIGKLDLSALIEFRRSGAGTVELKFADRMKALERLLELSGPSGEEQLDSLFQRMEDEEE
ncbi:XRE family transcriptional regulator [Flintibacter sp. KGMB00164]|uniref:XRE family transcriptional regulator n=1 Tax=Flintibacter sp. KGMB00164 TaxID=2610895 RepID=UPI0012490BBD|nr:XRE family transcriptional regulator [Flintibacter sp. KGMB00164]